jgi:aspartyl-tRNA(Asn)/glutamyl-tRNA(Gln) amidotransferase subunit A
MATQELTRLSIAQLAELIKSSQLSPTEVIEASLARIDELDGSINSYITVMGDQARQSARDAERLIREGRYLGPLHGVPIGLKDIISTKDVLTTCGSQVNADWVPDHDATVTQRLAAAGAVIVGKHNCYEFACAPPNPLYGASRNPWNTTRDTGGSSSGTGAAIAAHMCYGGIGSDTGGSIRIPAGLCGIVGLKQTYGRASRRGVFPLCWSLDHAGPMARTVEDTAIILQAIAGFDPLDPTTLDLPVPDYRQALTGELRGLRAGIPANYFFDGVAPEVADSVKQAAKVLEGAGMQVEEVTIPHADYILPAWWTIFATESAAVHDSLIQTKGADYSDPVLTTVIPGGFLGAGALLKAQRARNAITKGMNEVLQQVDVLLTPVVPMAAWPLGGMHGLGNTIIEALTKLVSATAPFNLTGHPAISVPCGLDSEGLPIGLQIAGRAFDEETVLKVAHAYQSLSPLPLP